MDGQGSRSEHPPIRPGSASWLVTAFMTGQADGRLLLERATGDEKIDAATANPICCVWGTAETIALGAIVLSAALSVAHARAPEEFRNKALSSDNSCLRLIGRRLV